MTVVDGYGFLTWSRKFFDSDLWTEGREFSRAEAFMDLVQLAAWRDHHRIVQGRRVEIPRGCLLASERFLQGRWSWRSRGRVRRFLVQQVNAKRLARDPKTDLITICKYDTYQLGRPTNGPATDQQRTSDGPKRSKGEEGRVREKKTSTPTRPAVAVGLDSIPEHLRRPEVEKAVREYVAYRGKARFRALPEEGWTKLWNRLAGLPVAEVVASFDRCIGSGNQGVFPPTTGKREPEGGSSRYREIVS